MKHNLNWCRALVTLMSLIPVDAGHFAELVVAAPGAVWQSSQGQGEKPSQGGNSTGGQAGNPSAVPHQVPPEERRLPRPAQTGNPLPLPQRAPVLEKPPHPIILKPAFPTPAATPPAKPDNPAARQTGGGSQSPNVPSGQAGNPSAHGTVGGVSAASTKTAPKAKSKSHGKTAGKKGNKGGTSSTNTPK